MIVITLIISTLALFFASIFGQKNVAPNFNDHFRSHFYRITLFHRSK